MGRNRVEYEDAPADVMKRLVSGARAGVKAAAAHWDEEFLPEHFEDGAAARYGYTPRSGEGEPAWVPGKKGLVLAGGRTKYGSQRVVRNRKYFHEKQRRGFGKTPLVYTGDTRQSALASGRVSSKVRGTLVEGTDAVKVERDFFRRPKNSRVDKPAELTATTPAEVAELRLVVEATAARAAEKGGRRRTKKV